MQQGEVMAGVDVSGTQLDVALWPGGESFSVGNDAEGVERLLGRMVQLRPCGVIIEASGGLESLLVGELCAAQVPVAVVNPRQVREFARSWGSWPRPIALMRKSWHSLDTPRAAVGGSS
jgi:transposase